MNGSHLPCQGSGGLTSLLWAGRGESRTQGADQGAVTHLQPCPFSLLGQDGFLTAVNQMSGVFKSPDESSLTLWT